MIPGEFSSQDDRLRHISQPKLPDRVRDGHYKYTRQPQLIFYFYFEEYDHIFTNPIINNIKAHVLSLPYKMCSHFKNFYCFFLW